MSCDSFWRQVAEQAEKAEKATMRRAAVDEARALAHLRAHLPRWLHWAVRQRRLWLLRVSKRVFRVPPLI